MRYAIAGGCTSYELPLGGLQSCIFLRSNYLTITWNSYLHHNDLAKKSRGFGGGTHPLFFTCGAIFSSRRFCVGSFPVDPRLV